MLLDSSKFGVTSLTTFLPAFGADVLITDAGIPAEVSGQMVEHGVDVHIAQETERSVR